MSTATAVLPSMRVPAPSKLWRSEMDETRLSLLYRVRDLNDEGSWQEFYDLYFPLLMSFVKAKGVNNYDSAEDVVQELLINLARRLPQLEFDKQRGRFRTYLWQATHNAVVSWFRKHAKHSAASGLEMESHIAELEYASQTEPDQEFVTAMRKRVLDQALVRLKKSTKSDTWSCFELHILQNIPAKEVALRLDRTENSVYVNAARVLQRLRLVCAEYTEGLDDESE